MFDTDVKITSDTILDAIANQDGEGILRYTPLPGNNPKADISPELALQNPLCDNPFELVYEVL